MTDLYSNKLEGQEDNTVIFLLYLVLSCSLLNKALHHYLITIILVNTQFPFSRKISCKFLLATLWIHFFVTIAVVVSIVTPLYMKQKQRKRIIIQIMQYYVYVLSKKKSFLASLLLQPKQEFVGQILTCCFFVLLLKLFFNFSLSIIFWLVLKLQGH